MIGRRRRAAGPARRHERFRIRRDRHRPAHRVMHLGEAPARGEVPSVRVHARLFVLGFAIVFLIGTVLLALPWTTATGETTPVVDALFTAISAACLTGLVTVDTQDHWNGFGQAVILILMQIGTLGFLVGASIILQVIRRGSTLRDSILLRDGEPAITLRETRTLARRILWFTLGVEAVGVIAITIGLLPGRSVLDALWHGVFLSVAALSNAGFDLSGDYQSLIPYQTVVWFNLVIMLLMQAGSLGFLVLADAWEARRWRSLALDTKLVLISHVVLLVGGAGFFLIAEWAGAMATAPTWAKPMISLFQSMSTRSGGFTTVNLAEASAATLFLFAILMIIGGAPASTAGGVRLTTVAVVVVAVFATLSGRTEPQVMGRRLPVGLIFRAMTVIVLFMAAHGAATVALYFTENHFGGAEFEFLPLLFEAASALATDGLSTGITPSLSDAGKLVLCVTMFLGRIGPLTAVYALQQRQRTVRYRYPVEPVRIG